MMVFEYAGSTAEQIRAHVTAGVRSGALPVGSRLPAVRTLATELGVSPGTVAAAYRQLRDTGVVATDGRRGTTVRPVTSATSVQPHSAAPEASPGISATLPSPGISATLSPGISAIPPRPRSERVPPVPPGARDVSSGAPNPLLLPDPVEYLGRVSPRRIVYGSVASDESVTALVAHARARLTADGVPAESIVVTSGALDGIERVFSSYVSVGDRVAVEDPAWSSLLDLVGVMGMIPVPVRVDDDGPVPDSLADALASGARALVLTSRAQNPTGAAVTAARADQLRAVLADYPRTVVIEDDHAGELAAVPLATIAGATDNWVFIRSVAKPYGPDLRCAVVTGSSGAMERLENRYGLAARWVSTVLQGMVVAMWSDPVAAEVVAAAGRTYDRRRDAFLSALADRGISAHGRTGLNVWIPVDDETVVAGRLLAAGWVVAPGSVFRIASPPGIRLTVSELAPEEIDPLADAVAAAIRSRASRPALV